MLVAFYREVTPGPRRWSTCHGCQPPWNPCNPVDQYPRCDTWMSHVVGWKLGKAGWRGTHRFSRYLPIFQREFDKAGKYTRRQVTAGAGSQDGMRLKEAAMEMPSIRNTKEGAFFLRAPLFSDHLTFPLPFPLIRVASSWAFRHQPPSIPRIRPIWKAHASSTPGARTLTIPSLPGDLCKHLRSSFVPLQRPALASCAVLCSSAFGGTYTEFKGSGGSPVPCRCGGTYTQGEMPFS